MNQTISYLPQSETNSISTEMTYVEEIQQNTTQENNQQQFQYAEQYVPQAQQYFPQQYMVQQNQMQQGIIEQQPQENMTYSYPPNFVFAQQNQPNQVQYAQQYYPPNNIQLNQSNDEQTYDQLKEEEDQQQYKKWTLLLAFIGILFPLFWLLGYVISRKSKHKWTILLGKVEMILFDVVLLLIMCWLLLVI